YHQAAMRRWYTIPPLVAAAAVAAVALPSTKTVAAHAARSNSGQVSVLQDDEQLLYRGPRVQTKTLKELKSLGVDVVKVTMVWWLVAPQPTAKKPPRNFDATNPADYGAGWARYDALVRTAQSLGLRVYFQFAPPDPAWARDPHVSGGQGSVNMRMPRAKWFAQFVQAVGTRYSGQYSTGSGEPLLPRVTWWGIWNEPNYPAWLNPQHQKKGGVNELLSPLFYRSLADAAYKGLSASGHGSDTILIGETANRGEPTPVPFVEDLYCVNSHYKPLSGKAAETVGCPTTPNRSQFMAQNPGLFHIGGFAHHPYQFTGSPGKRDKADPQWVTIYNLSWLERVLKHVFAGYGRSGSVPLYLTEWGFITHPPHPPSGSVSLSQAATWINLGEYLTWEHHYVKALSQYLLRDAPNNGFATGLEFINGKPKPELRSFRLPIWLPDARHGHHVAVWGQLRPAKYGGPQTGELQFKPKGSSTWTQLATVSSPSPEGFFLVHVSIPSAGQIRLKWWVSHSRVVSVS
ncbi:MAG TPA: hypothetical protein VE983_12880, partial [Solirubrobacteraceae bacterium]|nr:hypothetical protein [Solirubrobacteraceae bacterium]